MKGNDMKPNGITVVGSGYVGTVLAASLAAIGNDVVAVEVNPEKLSSFQAGKVPFYEPGLQDLVAKGLDAGLLRFTGDIAAAVPDSDIIFLAVGTPSDEMGRADLRALESAAAAIAPHLDRYRVIVTKSTVPVGTGERLRSIIQANLPPRNVPGLRFAVASNPEFLRQGSALDDFFHPDRIVIGSDDPRAIEMLAATYRPIVEQAFDDGKPDRPPALIPCGLATAEAVKYASNAFLATKISFINEMARICDGVGADVTEVAHALGLDRRIGPDFLNAGIGWGGSCFRKDINALAATARDAGYEPRILQAVSDVNDAQRALVVEMLEEHFGGLRGRCITLLGLSFKPGTDDTRDAPSIDIARALVAAGASVRSFDPLVGSLDGIDVTAFGDPYTAASGADAVVILTEWPEIVGVDLERLGRRLRGNLLVDGRNALRPGDVERAGLVYRAMGRGMRRAVAA